MKRNFLIMTQDKLTSSLFEGAIQQIMIEAPVFIVSDTDQAMKTLEDVALTNEYSQEFHILLDMHMPFLEAFVFLHELYQTRLPFGVRTYLLEDYNEPKEYRPDVSRYRGIHFLGRDAIYKAAEYVVNDLSNEYFQHSRTAKYPVYI